MKKLLLVFAAAIILFGYFQGNDKILIKSPDENIEIVSGISSSKKYEVTNDMMINSESTSGWGNTILLSENI